MLGQKLPARSCFWSTVHENACSSMNEREEHNKAIWVFNNLERLTKSKPN